MGSARKMHLKKTRIESDGEGDGVHDGDTDIEHDGPPQDDDVEHDEGSSVGSGESDPNDCDDLPPLPDVPLFARRSKRRLGNGVLKLSSEWFIHSLTGHCRDVNRGSKDCASLTEYACCESLNYLLD